jgi:hypothetical protein
MTNNKPVHQIKEGRVRAAFWSIGHGSPNGYTFTFERLYKQKESWKSASSFYIDDIERLEKVLSEAKSWFTQQAPAAEEVA